MLRATRTRIHARRPPALRAHAYAELKGLIVRGDLSPGSFLSERQLSARFGMSKTPIRNALERLEAEGFVIISPQQGVVVREISVREIADQFQLRLALEGFVLRSIAGKLSPEETRRLREHLRLQERAARGGDVVRTVELDTEFHMLFCSFLGNEEILRVMQSLRDRVFHVILRVFRQNGPARLASNLEEHRGIAAAAIDGDAERAVARLRDHLEYGKRSLVAPGTDRGTQQGV